MLRVASCAVERLDARWACAIKVCKCFGSFAPAWTAYHRTKTLQSVFRHLTQSSPFDPKLNIQLLAMITPVRYGSPSRSSCSTAPLKSSEPPHLGGQRSCAQGSCTALGAAGLQCTWYPKHTVPRHPSCVGATNWHALAYPQTRTKT